MQIHVKAAGVLVVTTLIVGIFVLRDESQYVVEEDSSRTRDTFVPPVADFTTDTWGIFNPKSGEVLSGSNTHTTRPIASLTKLFTAYAVLETESLHDTVVITHSDVVTEGRAGKLIPGERTTLHELLFPLLLESSNDAGAAIHRTLGEHFDGTVTDLTTSLTLSSTHLVDATGLSDEDVSSVDDLARFFFDLKKNHPHALDITQLKLYVGKDAGWINNDPARSFPNFTGGKHGFTDAAGRTFIGTFKGEGATAEIGIILLGSRNLHSDIERALTYVKEHPALSICYNAGTCPSTHERVSLLEQKTIRE